MNVGLIAWYMMNVCTITDDRLNVHSESDIK